MAIIRKKELKSMGAEALKAKLFEVRKEYHSEHGLVMRGGRSSNPGRIKELRHTVARILTYLGQKETPSNSKPAAKAAAASNQDKAKAKAMTPAAQKAAGQPVKQ